MSKSPLKQLFPLIRDTQEIMADINANPKLTRIFSGWTPEQQTEFLDFCTGNRGVKILYDVFFKETLSPELDSSRLADFLSTIFEQHVTILEVLPSDNSQLAAEHTLIITDILVRLQDGSIVNVELQRIGYTFPGERAACYSADLLLRQYKRVRDRHLKDFSYRDIKPVITIVLFAKSPKEFLRFPTTCIHTFAARSDTGLTLNLLQKYIFISLDIFQKNCHNKSIDTKIAAWLTFLSSDSPDDICQLILQYPEFKPIYETIYNFCLNTERTMEMFSKELQILDKNTVQYMIDEIQNELDSTKNELDSTKDTLDKTKNELDSAKDELDSTKDTLDKTKNELDFANSQIAQYASIIKELGGTLPEQPPK